MPNVTSVTITAGVPTAGSGTVSTLDGVLGSTLTTSVSSTAAESSHVLKASAGALYRVTIVLGTTSGWLMLFDATSAPADGAVTPVFAVPVLSDGTSGVDSFQWGAPPKVFATGITAVFSTTGPFTKTASATASFFADIL